jgi:hypothetical protein
MTLQLATHKIRISNIMEIRFVDMQGLALAFEGRPAKIAK